MTDHDYLNTSVVDQEGVRLVNVSGDIDLGSVGALEEVCRAPPQSQRLVLDLSKVEFIDVVGLRKVLELGSGEETMTLISPSRIVRRMIILAGLRDAFSFKEKSAESSDV